MAIGILVLGLFLAALITLIVNQFRGLTKQIQTLERTLSSQIYMLQKTIHKDASSRQHPRQARDAEVVDPDRE